MADIITSDGTQSREPIPRGAVGRPLRGGPTRGGYAMAKKSVKTSTRPVDVPDTIIVSDVITSEPAESLIGTVPANIPAEPEPEPVIIPAWESAFRSTFPTVANIPAWVGPMVTTIRGAWDAVPAADRKTTTFDAWRSAFAVADPIPNDTNDHRYTGGGGRDIARTQNAIYVAFMLAGIPFVELDGLPIIDAFWDFVIPVHTCNYREKRHAFTTLTRYTSHDHNDTPGFGVNAIPENAVRVWVNAKTAKPAGPVDDGSDDPDGRRD